MYSKAFFKTKLGQASLASIVATTTMVALTTQMNMVAGDAHFAQPKGATTVLIEMA